MCNKESETMSTQFLKCIRFFLKIRKSKEISHFLRGLGVFARSPNARCDGGLRLSCDADSLFDVYGGGLLEFVRSWREVPSFLRFLTGLSVYRRKNFKCYKLCA